MLILSTMPTTEMQTVTSDDVTVITNPQSGLYITVTKGTQSKTIRLWTIQEHDFDGNLVNQLEIAENPYLREHSITKLNKIYMRYYFEDKTSDSTKRPQFELTITPTTNGFELVGRLFDYDDAGDQDWRPHTVQLNYDEGSQTTGNSLIITPGVSFTMTVTSAA